MKNDGNIFAVKLYFKDDKHATVIQYYKLLHNAKKRCKQALLTVYDRAEIYLTNSVYNLDDNILMINYWKDLEHHQIREYSIAE